MTWLLCYMQSLRIGKRNVCNNEMFTGNRPGEHKEGCIHGDSNKNTPLAPNEHVEQRNWFDMFFFLQYYSLYCNRNLAYKCFCPKFPSTINNPTSCRREEVNEVCSEMSGPPVSSCSLCTSISWCFLLILTFNAPVTQLGLMKRRKHELPTSRSSNWSTELQRRFLNCI